MNLASNEDDAEENSSNLHPENNPTWMGKPHRVGSDKPFYLCLGILGSVYIFLILGMLIADLCYTSTDSIWSALSSEEIQYSIKLSLISCTISAILSLWVAIPIGYLMSRHKFPGRNFLDALLDIPIILPPLVIGLSLLILFHFDLFEKDRFLGADGVEHIRYWRFNDWFPAAYNKFGVVLAQFMVAAAFAVRTMRATFDQIDPRREKVALTLGCRRSQAFWQVVLPEAKSGILTAGTLAWARSMGEFGPILIFAGATRMKTEVLPTTVFLELSVGNIKAALAVSLLMVFAAMAVLLIVRVIGRETPIAGQGGHG